MCNSCSKKKILEFLVFFDVKRMSSVRNNNKKGNSSELPFLLFSFSYELEVKEKTERKSL